MAFEREERPRSGYGEQQREKNIEGLWSSIPDWRHIMHQETKNPSGQLQTQARVDSDGTKSMPV